MVHKKIVDDKKIVRRTKKQSARQPFPSLFGLFKHLARGDQFHSPYVGYSHEV